MKIRGKNHGYSGTKLYNSWRAMKQRCYDKSQYSKSYQGRSIKVCEDWMRFAPFMEWALNNGYKKGYTIERIDPSKGYYPENCEWVTRSENTRRRNINYNYSERKPKGRLILTNESEYMTVREYAKKHNKVYNTFRVSLNGLGMVIKENELQEK